MNLVLIYILMSDMGMFQEVKEKDFIMSQLIEVEMFHFYLLLVIKKLSISKLVIDLIIQVLFWNFLRSATEKES